MKKICVLIPSYNEAKTIGSIVRYLTGRHLPVYVIDDGSTDATAALARAEGAHVISNVRNLGKGAALRAGFTRALADGYDAALIMDGDDQHDVNDIAHIVKKAHESDAGIVVGNRMLDTTPMPLVRKLVNHFMSWLIALVSHQHVPDTQCGFRLVSRQFAEKFRPTTERYELESEMLIQAGRLGLRIESIPIPTVYAGEASHIHPLIDTLRFLRLVFRYL